jgi:hypothetical protein
VDVADKQRADRLTPSLVSVHVVSLAVELSVRGGSFRGTFETNPRGKPKSSSVANSGRERTMLPTKSILQMCM